MAHSTQDRPASKSWNYSDREPFVADAIKSLVGNGDCKIGELFEEIGEPNDPTSIFHTPRRITATIRRMRETRGESAEIDNKAGKIHLTPRGKRAASARIKKAAKAASASKQAKSKPKAKSGKRANAKSKRSSK